MFIESEDRYLWKKENRVNEEYLLRENIGNKHVDYDDYIYSAITETCIKPEENEDNVIEERLDNIVYKEDDVKGVKFSKFLKVGDFFISEVELLEKDTLNKIEIINNEDNNYLFDGNYSRYERFDEVVIMFKDKRTIDNILLKIYYKSDIAINIFKVDYISENGYELYHGEYETNNKYFDIKKEDLSEHLSYESLTYLVKKKLYKTYDLEEEITTDYYAFKEGYERIDSSKKTFYRYIMNDYVLLGPFGMIIEDADYCIKHFCQIAYLEEKETPKEEPKEEEKEEEPEEEIPKEEEKKEEEKHEIVNPKTIDHIDIFILLMVTSFISLIFMYRRKIYLVLSKRFKFK